MTLRLQQSGGRGEPSAPHAAAPAPHHAEGTAAGGWGAVGRGWGARGRPSRGKALKCAGKPAATPSASSRAARLQGKQFTHIPESRLSSAAPANKPVAALPCAVLSCRAPQPGRPDPTPPAAPARRPAPLLESGASGSRAAAAPGLPERSPGEGSRRSSWLRRCGCRRRGRCCYSRRSPWLSPGLAGAPGACGPPAAGIGGCFCPAPHPPPPPRSGAHLPPAPHVHCGSRAAGQRREAAREAPGRSAPAQRRGRPGGERQRRLQPAPPRALLRQRLRRTREAGWARESEGATSHSEASSHCQPPSSAAQDLPARD